ncbi:uncharacterized protein LOC116209260 [Punica granatum]|uniref:Uncharacterized protein LOC116209260 n=1 Tax=Punica granatum TaxID=22663 RepID=A0A6P8DMX9_PUNGR|nr:uncharacterized protein LOC116209260 [Punica granatum]
MTTSLRHLSDPEHALILRELSENCRVPCRICELQVNGPAYCCWGCEIFLHRWCAELPLETQHPAHPHPLALSSRKITLSALGRERSEEAFVYRCSEGDCYFNVDVTWAFLNLYPSEEKKDTIQHIAHKHHPLTYFRLNKPIKVWCRDCEQQIAGPFYGCPICSFYLHEFCAELPREISRHPSHPGHRLTLSLSRATLCRACHFVTNPLGTAIVYKCQDCEGDGVIAYHIQCDTSFHPSKYEENDCGTITHFSHEHPLKSFFANTRIMRIRFYCEGCGLNISGDFYGCPVCGFFLHRSCAEELPREMSHFRHPIPDHPLALRERGHAWTLKCDSCSLNSRCAFTCEKCDFALDLVCALSTFSAFKEGVATEIQHFSHDHSLTLVYRRSGPPGGCIICGVSVTGLAYSCQTCYKIGKRFVLHKSCAELPQELEHPFHPPHPLTLQSKRHFYCDAYGTKSGGFCFGCDECQFFLCLAAASLKPTLRHQPHEHDLTHFERISDRKFCSYCGESSSVDSYRCVECDFTVHYSCIRMLPLAIKHNIHFHQLALRDKFIDRFNEQYCDVCEKTRRTDRGIYYCAECNFSAHIGCIIPSVAIEEAPELEKVDEEIASVKAEIEETGAMQMKIEALRKRLEELTVKRDALAS